MEKTTSLSTLSGECDPDPFRKKFFPKVSNKDWSNWQWQIKNAIVDLNKLEEMFSINIDKKEEIQKKLAVKITPYYANVLYNSGNLHHHLLKTVVPSSKELIQHPSESIDPLAEDHDSPVPGIVHRYPDRALFLVSNSCSTYCRYCTRSRVIDNCKMVSGKKYWQAAIDYIKAHPEIRDVIVSGGDPLVLPDDDIDYILNSLFNIKHLEMVRIGTKVPAVLPMRITKSLLTILKKYSPLYMSLHFSHADEITPETTKACLALANIGIPLGSQTVLLNEINNDAVSIKQLFQGLLKIKVRPYYLYQCDPIVGSSHFRTPVKTGLDIVQALRGWTSGYAVPHFIIDTPGGGGKVPLTPDYFQEKNGDKIILKNYEGKLFEYVDSV